MDISGGARYLLDSCEREAESSGPLNSTKEQKTIDMDFISENIQNTQTMVLSGALLLLLLWESAAPFYKFFNGSFLARGRHALRNLVLGAVNTALIAFIFIGLWLWASTWADTHHVGVLHWLGERYGMPIWVHAVGAMLLIDAWTYLWHRMNHVVPFFWRFHRVHHSDNHMDVTTAGRFHIGEILFSSLLRIPLIIILGIHLWELVLYETMMFTVVQFHHANIGLPELLDRAMRAVIVTPAMHKVHHSRWRPETDSNFSALFSFWDRIGRSFRLHPDLPNLRLGLDGFDRDDVHTVFGMLKTPIKSGDRTAT